MIINRRIPRFSFFPVAGRPYRFRDEIRGRGKRTPEKHLSRRLRIAEELLLNFFFSLPNVG